jgi:hypothetical protein
VSSCPSGKYKDSVALVCKDCHSTCQTCSDFTSTSCTYCKTGLYLYAGACVSSCPQGQQKFDAQRKCIACHSDCSSCSGPTAKECLACNGTKYLFNSTCVDTCPTTRIYINSTLRVCRVCTDVNCDKCSTSESVCDTCKTGYYVSTNYFNCLIQQPISTTILPVDPPFVYEILFSDDWRKVTSDPMTLVKLNVKGLNISQYKYSVVPNTINPLKVSLYVDYKVQIDSTNLLDMLFGNVPTSNYQFNVNNNYYSVNNTTVVNNYYSNTTNINNVQNTNNNNTSITNIQNTNSNNVNQNNGNTNINGNGNNLNSSLEGTVQINGNGSGASISLGGNLADKTQCTNNRKWDAGLLTKN